MILCLDIGNTQIFAGVFKGDELILQFRHSSAQNITSDQLGVFFRTVLKENKINPENIHQIAICSVVPHLDYTIRSACIKYFSIEPFVLKIGVKTGLKVRYKNPAEVGADRIANAVGAVNQLPDKNLIIVDMGTATTICAVSKNKDYLGGVIFPGMKISMNALQSNTAKLPSIEIAKPESIYGTNTVESIRIGLYYGQLETIRAITNKIIKQNFDDNSIVIGTGGFANLFSDENIFDLVEPNLVFYGLKAALQLNHT